MGIAYCGLVCAACSKNAECAGCRDDGCKDKEWCKNLKCCRAKGLNGCWECGEFPCTGGMLDKPRIRAFARFVKDNGMERLLQCLERNERAGLVYHYPGGLVGDYDRPETEEAIMELIADGPGRAKDGHGANGS